MRKARARARARRRRGGSGRGAARRALVRGDPTAAPDTERPRVRVTPPPARAQLRWRGGGRYPSPPCPCASASGCTRSARPRTTTTRRRCVFPPSPPAPRLLGPVDRPPDRRPVPCDRHAQGYKYMRIRNKEFPVRSSPPATAPCERRRAVRDGDGDDTRLTVARLLPPSSSGGAVGQLRPLRDGLQGVGGFEEGRRLSARARRALLLLLDAFLYGPVEAIPPRAPLPPRGSPRVRE